MDFIALHIAEDGENLKLIWTGFGPGEGWNPPPYFVDAGLLQQAANAVREHLRTIAFLPPGRDRSAFLPLLQNLARRGHELYLQLMPEPDLDGEESSDVRERLEAVLNGTNGRLPDLAVTLETASLFVPWGFVFSASRDILPREPRFTLADMDGFWLSRFRIKVAYGGSSPLPRERIPSFRKLYALDEDMFTRARTELAPECGNRLEALLQGEPGPTMDWDSFEDAWKQVAHVHDTVLFLFGHSDGQRIRLNGESPDDPKYEMLSSSLKRFRKRWRRSASVFVLNGCRTSAPAPASSAEPISANFLKATRGKAGYYGFIGTEAEVPNTFACRYGTEFFWRLCMEGKSVGEAFDELLGDESLFPQNILYTCYAERDFRFAVPAGVESRS